jgi:hypothetical protein
MTTISIRKGARVFIVEDNQERLDWFSMKMPHIAIFHTQDPDVAVEQLRSMPPETFDAIFLDFDLGPDNVMNSTINSIPVVDFLNSRLTTRKSQRNIIIHSANPVGATWMQAILPGATQIPFGTFDIKEV